MSYILRALRKSEAERARGTVPDLATQHAVAASVRRPLWPWIVAGALVVNAAVIVSGVWRPEVLIPGPSQSVEAGTATVARPVPPQTTAGPIGKAASSPPAARQSALEPEDAATPAPTASRGTAAEDSLGDDVAAKKLAPARLGTSGAAAPRQGADLPNAPPPPVPQRTAATAPKATATKPPRKPAEVRSPPVQAVPVQTPPVQTTQARTPSSVPTEPAKPEPETALPAGPDVALAIPKPEPPAAEAPPEPDPYASVPMLWQLPGSIRSKLPELAMAVHVYAPESSGRFVIVNRRKYREGDVLERGVKLEAIVPDGIVLVHQGRTFKLGN